MWLVACRSQARHETSEDEPMNARTSQTPRALRTGAGITTLLLLLAAPASVEAQDCRDWGYTGNYERVCEVREATVQSAGALDIDAGMNGGIQVMGSSRSDVRIHAEVWAHARSETRAEEIMDEIQIRTENGRLRADGPRQRNRESWGVNWRVEVPAGMDLDLETHNGGIEIEGVASQIRFSALNGGVSLNRLAGDVRGKTTNGGVQVDLDGRSWDGRGLDVTTVNGGVEVTMPEGYSADFETGTVNGRIDLDIPMTVSGRIDRQIRAELGGGGAPVRAVTTNGSVRIRTGR